MPDLSDRLDVPVGPAFDGFAVFVVGGAVRDALRGLEPQDVDLMAVPRPGAVDDPVDVLADRMTIIDPESTIPVFEDGHGREVALPRTEENAGVGHRGFDMAVVPAGTPVETAVETDLERRDLTVNAMAVDARTGRLFDPHDGRDDLADGVVRHVSPAFREDPLRVVRLARFTPRLEASVAPETRELARDVAQQTGNDGVSVLADEHLPVERVTKEVRKVVRQAPAPGRFFAVLADVDAFAPTFPGLAAADVGVATVAATVTAAGQAATTAPLDAVLVALGDLLGEDAGAFVRQQAFSRQERAAVVAGRDVLGDVARFDRLPAREAVEVFDRVAGDRGPTVEAVVAAASARARRADGRFDRVAVERRVADARAVFDAVDGQQVMVEAGVTPADVGGEAFGDLVADHRARRLESE